MKLFSGDLDVDAINNGGNKHGQQTRKNYRPSIKEEIQVRNRAKPKIIACRNCGKNHEVRKCPAYNKE